MAALKNDTDKLPMELLPFDVLESASRVLQQGAKKYSARNWEQGFTWGRLLGAVLRHLFAWGKGERVDPEWGYSHLDHAIVSLMFLRAHELRGLGTDDVPALGTATFSVLPIDTAVTYHGEAALVKSYADPFYELQMVATEAWCFATREQLEVV